MKPAPCMIPRPLPAVPFPHHAALALALALALTLVPRAEAQIVRGVLTEEGTGLPLEGALVALLPLEGDSVHAAVFTDGSGTFVLRALPGRWRLRSDLIGYRTTFSAPFDLEPGTGVRIDLLATTEAVHLEGLSVTVSPRRCLPRSGEGEVVAVVWQEARKALEASRWGVEQELVGFEAVVWERTLDPDHLDIREERRHVRSSQGRRPFESEPPESLAAHGFVQQTDSGTYYYAPDERVLLSDVFLEDHCFGLRRSPDYPRLLGLTFEPIGGSGPVDVAGVLWLDEETRELRHLEYRYARLDLGVPTDGLGGRVEFQRLPSGVWMSLRWWIRMPVIQERHRPLPGRDREVRTLELTALLERGGEVSAVVTRDGTRLEQLDRPRVQGMVYDSVGFRPLVGAEVFLAGTEHVARTDEHGRFMLSAEEGLFQLTYRHPFLDTLGFEPMPLRIDMRRGVVRQVRLAVPTDRTLLASTCSERGPVTVVGSVRDSRGEVLPGAQVRLGWEESGGVVQRRQARADARGGFAFCGVPAETTLLVRAVLAGLTSEVRELALGARGSVVDAQIVMDDRRTGTLTGRVVEGTTARPVEQAGVRVTGTELQTWTDGEGEFTLTDVPPGRQVLEVSHLLYGVRTDSLDVRSDSTASLEVRLVGEAIELEPITVTVRQFRTPGEAAFHERMERGMGQYLTAEQIDLAQPGHVTEVLRRIPGLSVTCGTPSVLGSGCLIQLDRARRMNMRGREEACPIKFFLDGSSTSQEIIESLRPESIAGIEVYNGLSEVPPQFRRGPDTRCGVIAVWLKTGR